MNAAYFWKEMTMRVLAAVLLALAATPCAAQDGDQQAADPVYIPNSFVGDFRSEGIRLTGDRPLYLSDEGLVYRFENFEVAIGPVELPIDNVARGQHAEDDVWLVRFRFGLHK